MQYCVNNISKDYNFYIKGVSYAGEPKNNTMMYISKKVEYLLKKIEGKKNCLVFLENGISVPSKLKKENCFIFSDNPQYAYAKVANELALEQRKWEKENKYILTDDGYYLGKNVTIGRNAYIEPNVLIGHNVSIGDNACILAGTIIKHATIGDNFFCNEHAVIGNYGFTLSIDDNGNNYRIPSLGNVIIGDYVEVGPFTDVAAGTCGDTILEDYVKLDALIHIGHEAHLHKNVEITAGAVVAGFVDMEEKSYVGINASIKNRIRIGENCVIGMGTNVTKSVEQKMTVIGNPAHPLIKNS